MIQSNFKFLSEKWPMLYDLGHLAEKNIYDDPNTTLIKLGMLGELIVDYMFAYDNLEEPYDNSQVNKIRVLKQNDLLPYEIDQILFTLRKSRNKAAHEGYGSVNDAKVNTSMAFKLAVWFMQTYGEWDFTPRQFIMPAENIDEEYISKLHEENEELTLKYEEKLNKLQDELKNLRSKKDNEETRTRQQKSARAASFIELDEYETRKIIDEQLRSAGWETDSEKIRYSKATRPEEGKNLAITEWPTDDGRADYALFIGLKLVGVVEAKKGSKDIPSDIGQSRRYARSIKNETLICLNIV